MTTPDTAARLADAELGYPDTIADYIGRYCPTEFPWGADRSAELIMAELVRPLLADLERARRVAVALEQELAAAASSSPRPDLEFTVTDHRPAPQGSKRHIGRGRLLEQSKRVAPWRQAVDQAAQAAMTARHVLEHGGRPAVTPQPLDGPLSVEVVFTVRKPASAPKTRVTWPTTRDSGDIDKLLRSTFDALTTGGAVADDSRIVEVVSRKVFPGEGLDALETPGAVIRVWRLTEAVAS